MTQAVQQKTFRLGTRGSPLALFQSEKILARLKNYFPEERFETRLFQSLGDRDQGTPLETLARQTATASIFADEIEKALRSGEIDLAVHSLKDLTVNEDPYLCLAAVPEREDARDALVSAKGLSLAALPPGARIGTCSHRRSLQLLALRSDIEVRPVRGTVEGRLKKMDRGEYDGLILAAAGLHRLGLGHRISEYFSFDQMLPAPGQGALAVQCRKDNAATLTLLSRLDHPALHACVEAERLFLKIWGLDYDSALAAYAESSENEIVLRAFHPDFEKSGHVIVRGPDPMAVARDAKIRIESGS